MSNDERLLTTYDSALIKQLSVSVCNAILPILQQYPELVLVKYQSINWKQPQYQSALIAGLNKKISSLADDITLTGKIKEYLQLFLVPSFFTSPVFDHLEMVIEASIQRLNSLDLNSGDISQPLPVSDNGKSFLVPGAIAILLLDAENLQLDSKMENFLAQVSTYPLQVKIAFANWSKMGKRDIELHQRGYELIHVPVGKDNADGKMIALGSSVHERYHNAKEVIVCSSDNVMTNLCNHLQQNGLIVYQVVKKEEALIVLNSSTGKQITQFPPLVTEIPSIEEFIGRIKQLIKTQQKQHNIYWVKLSSLSKIFKSKYSLTISQVVSQHLAGKKARDFFMNYPADFAIHQVDSASELYITLFEVNQSEPGNLQEDAALKKNITSGADLEKVLKDILQELTKKSQVTYIDISLLGGGFNQRYGKPITEQIKSLHLTGNFIKFLQSCKSFDLKQIEKRWQVSLR
ncbi:NYN domain-containing protein [Nodularia chucula]|uniref:NYN domain-containing protein n=1 Tax=Nodularia chucula TaxID=3093667 RepID=UPI0039C67FD6